MLNQQNENKQLIDNSLQKKNKNQAALKGRVS